MKFMKIKHYFLLALSVLLSSALILNMSGCTSAKAADLMTGMTSESVSLKSIDDNFISNTASFSVDLFKKSIKEKDNSLISPLSVLLALSMTANGADKETLSQMQKVLGGDITISELNQYLYSYVTDLPNNDKSKLNISNSIWFRDDKNRLKVEKDFLQKNSNYYNASAYKTAFDEQTVMDINDWVKNKTDGTIDKIIDKIDPLAVIYLINAIVFDAEWETTYTKDEIHDDTFTNINGDKQTAHFMNSSENSYLDDGKATGFIKPYFNDAYSFVALLPNEGVSINDYISSLTGDRFLNALNHYSSEEVYASIPKFSYSYSVTMNDALKNLGIPNAFDQNKADFSKLGKSSDGNIFIGKVLHKTFIAVDELGTKAGAVTKVEMEDGSSEMELPKIVNLDRPFVYAIIDNQTNLPIFMGTVMSVK